MPAMNELESYHRAGLVEILKTTTLNVEFRTAPRQKEKASQYFMIGGSPVQGEHGMESMWGAVSGESNFYRYYLEIFGNSGDKNHNQRSLRDCLHIDQAILNNTNYFVTNEKILIQAGQNIQTIRDAIEISTPENCLEKIQGYFYSNYRTSNVSDLIKIGENNGPVILGSNTSVGFNINNPVSGEVYLSSYIDNRNLVIEGSLRNKCGDLVLEISNGKSTFHGNDAKITCVGKGPIVIGEKSFLQVLIYSDDEPYVSARTLSSGKVLFDRINIYSNDSSRYARINRETLELKGLSIGGPTRAH